MTTGDLIEKHAKELMKSGGLLCEFCGNPIEQTYWYRRRFCSRRCAVAQQRKEKNLKHNRQLKKEAKNE